MTKYALEDVKKLVNDAIGGTKEAVWFSGKSRSINYVIHTFQCGEGHAEHIVLQGLLKLQSKDFVKSVMTVPPPDTQICDEYGLGDYEGHNWYIKLAIEDAALTAISFHPVERPLVLANGIKLDVTLEVAKHYRPIKS